jgi:putative Holliday junction resolvase
VLVRQGARLGIDVGSVRIGVAVCDPAGSIATPVETVRRGAHDVERLVDLAAEYAAVELVVGLPVSLSGSHGPAAEAAVGFAARLARSVHVPVRLVDERLSTVGATRALRDSGVAGRRQRAVIDQAAAVIILQNALDAERSTGNPPGVRVPPEQGEA